MRVRSLILHDFRSWPEVRLDAHSGANLLLGPNGSGKSNLLEALHLCALGFSPRSRSEKDLVRWGADRFFIRLEASRGDAPLELAASCDLQGRKETRVDGTPGRLFSRLVGHISVVGLYPEDLHHVRGGPEARRSYLDALACQIDPPLVETLRDHARVVRQRNALLKDSEVPDPDVLDVLDQQMAGLAARILEVRMDLVERLVEPVSRIHQFLSDAKESVDLWYRGTYGDDDLPRRGPALLDRLLRRRDQLRRAESAARATLFGPQRDDLSLLLSGKPARETASQGQARTLAIALRLAAAELLSTNPERPPVLLLDDVFAELDGPRRQRLARLLPRTGQSFLCSPHRADLPFEVDRTFLLDGGGLREAVS
jgi:DNA replication and repair protein RecF